MRRARVERRRSRGRPRVRSGDSRARDLATRERLLEAARELFTERAFRRVTVRDISHAARANVAAVSYYFGDKLGLYREVVGEAIAVLRQSDPTTRAPEGASPQERIRHYVRAFVPALAMSQSRESWILKLLRHEMQDPTPLAQWIAEQSIMPRVRYLSAAVAELLDCPVDDARVGRCVISIQSQCLFFLPNRFRSTAFPDWDDMTRAELDRMADHIAEFSLAGITRSAEEAAQ